VNAILAFPDHSLDFCESGFSTVVLFPRRACKKAEARYGKDNRIKNGLIAIVKGTIDEDMFNCLSHALAE